MSILNYQNINKNKLLIVSILGIILVIIGFIKGFPDLSILGLSIITLCFLLYYLKENFKIE